MVSRKKPKVEPQTYAAASMMSGAGLLGGQIDLASAPSYSNKAVLKKREWSTPRANIVGPNIALMVMQAGTGCLRHQASGWHSHTPPDSRHYLVWTSRLWVSFLTARVSSRFLSTTRTSLMGVIISRMQKGWATMMLMAGGVANGYVDNSQSSPKGIHYRTLLQKVIITARSATFPSASAGKFISFDGLNVNIRDSSTSQLERNWKIGAAGELYVLELLSRLFSSPGDQQDGRRPTQSSLIAKISQHQHQASRLVDCLPLRLTCFLFLGGGRFQRVINPSRQLLSVQ